MNKYQNKRRVAIFIFGIILFTLLALSTFIEGDVKEDYINFKLFRKQIQMSQYDIVAGCSDSTKMNSEFNQMISELDISFYIFINSSLINFYSFLNEEYDNSIDVVTQEWLRLESLIDNRNIQSIIGIKRSTNTIIKELDSINITITRIVNRWALFYFILLFLNLLTFTSLLIFTVFFFSGTAGGNGSNGIMDVRNALIHGQEQERLRISLELHDKVAQDLFACKMIVNDISSSSQDEAVIASISTSLGLLDSSIQEVRDLSYSLRPPALQAIGIDSAMQGYIDNFSKKIAIPISFKAIGISNKKIEESVSINLYRILQETLNNTAKHAHAEHIDVKLIYTYPYLMLKIDDDGVGFRYVKSEMKMKGRHKLGLPGINERVSLLGGELIINTGKGDGTKILIKVPVEGHEKV